MKKLLIYPTCAFVALSTLISCTYSSCLSPYKAGTDERSLGTYLEDTLIKDKIKAKFLKDKNEEVRKAFMAISVSVHRGEVVMVGEIPNRKLRTKTVRIAKTTKGVRRVRTYLLPKAQRRTAVSDKKIAAKVKGRFVSDVDLKAFQVDVHVVHGHVVLAGVVDGRFLKKRCIQHASRVKGVVKVVDFVQLK